ncbi:TetR/AcrR family transcriptional regulator [Kitasatospora kifunensis]|uniref:AcrR family transcriptional regulator n=1 Tax=Kitasatospora kifunensis TaxID=58351 RepID=A0A7W7R9M2_KITKI|nr:TetR/AcrR family transcriptional regulator [Kitasatospora kifunensis]MBB4927909.1 AcrR family transcriptional regulator [Kitasatospora kifunensis]
MPKVVDPEARRAAVAEAVWRLIRKHGLQGVSVRAVAREAGLSAGALRHYFASQSEVLTFAMQLVIDRVRTRIQALEPQPDPPAAVRQAIEELLPLDPERLAEAEVWLAFTARAQTEPALRALRDTSYELLQDLCHHLVATLDQHGTAAHLDLVVETERLYALLDGLVVHCVIRPDRATPSLMRDVITRHLAELTGASENG